LDDRSILFVDFQAPEEVYGVIEVGAAIDIAPFADAGTIYQAKVRKIDSRIDQASRSFTVRAEIDNAADRLRPGMSFKIDFQLPGRAYPVVPEAAIIWGGDGAYIWLVENGVAKRLSVTIVGRQDGQVLVRAPINEGSIVIAEGVQKVREGTAVEISRLYADPAKNTRAGSTSTPTVEIPAALPVTEPVADRP
ncbi:MAG: efflux RND transporter periplasmic adaptor subunit, partial [Arenicella sp.]|nr:efflux RND transporter periplasmic adaptor subunit [Arenicella sp.]